ncbi:MAG: DUF58 domain-containing protein [Planctomycetes bacterium]|nr:DUF58 domain-containing protein [Planctomycetota bacterium]
MPAYVDPHILARIKGYELRSLRLVESFMAGMHKSKLLGISTEFAQHRPYSQGDDTKHLDWKVYAKTDRFYLREYEAETSMQVVFLLDVSKSMFFKGAGSTFGKLEYAATTLSALAYLLMQQKDSFSLVLFDSEVRSFLPARGSQSHYRNMLELLEKASPGAETDLAKALMTVVPQLKRRSLLIVFSDFLTDTAELSLGLGQVSFGEHDLMLFHVEDPLERDFALAGQTVFVGPENEGRLLCDPRDLRHAYLAARKRHIAGLRDLGLRSGYDVDEMPTDAPIEDVLSKLLAYRAARRKRG